MGGGGVAVGGIGGFGLLAVVVIGYFLGIDVTPILNDAVVQQGGGGEITAEDEQEGEFASVVLADTEEVWAQQFQAIGSSYSPPTMVLYKGVTQSQCGSASGATGPFYCPLDRKIYLDTAFFTTLSRQLGAKGDFANAYVVAHEVGHAVQDQLGILEKTTQLRQRSDEATANAISVRVELQADCFAVLWARENHQYLDKGDANEAIDAAGRIGDDTLQREAGRRPMPDSFTHGSSEQRQRWFAKGYDTGDIDACDTFGTDDI